MWTDINIKLLISAVELNECLWNVALPEYRNRAIKDSPWSKIAADDYAEFTSLEIQAKWKNLRVQFRRNYNNYKSTKSGQACKNVTPWKYYRLMMFLEKAEEEQTTISESNLVSSIKTS